MTDHVLVEALRERDPDAPASMYDAYADRLYAYCWFRLREQDVAQTALRDTFTVAEAHIAKLCDPDQFGPWLYAIARLECERRSPGEGWPSDLPAVGHVHEDDGQRVVAQQAVHALPPAAQEMLELRIRHQLSVPDLAAVLDLPVKDTQAALDRGHADLETALTAAILVRQGQDGCSERGLLLLERRGELSLELSDRLARHAMNCAACNAFRPRAVSAAKVFGRLPWPDPPEGLRWRVMSNFTDTEPIGERLSAVARVTEFSSDGFPRRAQRDVSPEPAEVSRWERFPMPRRVRTGAAVAALLVLLGGGVAVLYRASEAGDQDAGTADTGGGTSSVSGADWPEGGPIGRPDALGGGGTLSASATFPLGARASSAPSTSFPPPAAPWSLLSAPGGTSAGIASSVGGGTLVVSSSALDLAGGSDGAIELAAAGGPVAWLARASGPIRLSRSSGRLEAGQSMTLGVHVARKARSSGEGHIDFAPGGPHVRVTWRPANPGPGQGPAPAPPRPVTTAPKSVDPISPSASGRPDGQPPSSDTPRPINKFPMPMPMPMPVPTRVPVPVPAP